MILKDARFFFIPDDGLAAAGEPGAAPPPPTVAFEDGPPEGFTIVDEAPAGPSDAQLKADYERVLAENSQLKARPDPTAALAPVLHEFSEGLKDLAARPIHVQAQAPTPQTDPEAEDRAFDESFLEGPSKNVRKIVGTMVEAPIQVLLQSNMNVARSLVAMRPADAGLFSKYGPEIDAEVAAQPLASRAKDPVAAYESAIAVVRGRHYQELIAAERDTWAQGQAAQAPAAAPAPAPVAPRGAVLSGSPSAPPSNTRTLTRAEDAKVRAYMDENQVPADKFETILELVRDGTIA